MDDMFDPLGNFINKDNSLFGDESDEIDNIFGSSTKSDPIFGDDGNDDPFKAEEKPPKKEDKPKKEEKSLFGDDDPFKAEEKPPKKEDKPPKKEEKSLFDDDEDEKPPKKEDKPPKKEEKSLFGDDDPFKVEEKPPKKEEKPPKKEEKSLFGDDDPFKVEEKPPKKEEKSLFGDDDPFKAEEKPPKKEEKSLFGDDDPFKVEEKPPKKEEKPLFDDDPLKTETKPPKKEEKPLFGDDDPLKTEDKPPKEEKPLFDDNLFKTEDKPKEEEKPLFGDDDPFKAEEKPHNSPKKKEKVAPVPIVPKEKEKQATKEEKEEEEEEKDDKKAAAAAASAAGSINTKKSTKKPSSSSYSSSSSSSSSKKSADIGGSDVNTPLLPERREESAIATHKRRRTLKIALIVLIGLIVVGAAIALAILLQPATVSCNAEGRGNYFVRHVAAPTVGGASPPVVCSGHNKAFHVDGSGLLTIGGVRPNITLDCGGSTVVPLTDYDLVGCADLGVRGRSVSACAGLNFTYAFPSLSAGSYAVRLTAVNPRAPKPKIVKSPSADKETCGAEVAQLLTVVPSPSASAAAPSFICIDDDKAAASTRKYTLDGTFFIRSKLSGAAAAAEVPRVDVCGAQIPAAAVELDDCEQLPVVGEYEYIEACKALAFTYDGAECASGSVASIVITNPEPAACATGGKSAVPTVAAVRRPTVTAASPGIMCLAQSGADLVLKGTNLVTIDGALPAISIRDMASGEEEAVEVAELTGSSEIPGSGIAVHTGATVRLSKRNYTEPTGFELRVTSSDGTCSMAEGTTTTAAFAIEPAPAITGMMNTSVCAAAGPQTVYARGMFAVAEGENAGVSIAGGAEDRTTPFLTGECRSVEAAGTTFRVCDTLGFTLPGDAALAKLSVRVTTHCSAELDAAITHVPTPVVSTVSTQEVCSAEATPIQISGSNFLVEDGVPPEVTLGESYIVTGVTASGCVPADESAPYRLCTALDFELPADSLEAGHAELRVRNSAAGAGCAAETTFDMTIVESPAVTEFTTQYCEDQGGDIAISGTGFAPATLSVFLVDPVSGTEYKGELVEGTVTATAATARFAAGDVPAGAYNLVVQNTDLGLCRFSTKDAPVAVHANDVAILFADPAAVVASATTEHDITIQTANMGDDGPVWLSLTPSSTSSDDDAATELLYVRGENMTYDAATGRVGIVLPAGVAEGTTFTASALAPTTCSATTGTATILAVAPATSFTVESVTPAVLTAGATSFTVTASSEAFADAAALPEVYLLPETTADSNSGAVIRAGPVIRLSATQIEVQVDLAALGADTTYTIEISIAGAVAGARAEGALRVTSLAAPKIASATRVLYPGVNNKVNVTGTGFGSLTFSAFLHCQNIDKGAGIKGTNLAVASDTELTVSFFVDMTDLHDNCYLSLEEQENGLPAAVYHGMYVTTENTQTSNWNGVTLPAGVCAAAAASYNFGERAFVYLIGGDTDKACKGLATTKNVHIAEVNAYGNVPEKTSEWRAGSALPTGVAHASIERIEEYLYLMGGLTTVDDSISNENIGSDSVNVLNTVYRAQVLQESSAPRLTGVLSVSASEGSSGNGLSQGVYYYAVSAGYGADDELNPGGETLPSNLFSARVPGSASAAATVAAAVTLSWDTVLDAVSYNVYRGTSPDALTLLATTTEATYTDSGAATPSTTKAPLALGAIGMWRSVNGLKTGRYGHATAAIEMGGHMHTVFAFGGHAASGGAAYAERYETATVTVKDGNASAHGRQTQTLGAWKEGTYTVPVQAYWKGAVLSSGNIGYATEYLSTIVLGGSEKSKGYAYNYVLNSDDFENDAFVEMTPEFTLFGYCGFIFDKTLFIAGGTEDSSSFVPSKESCYAMALE